MYPFFLIKSAIILFQFCRTVHEIVKSLSESKRKERHGSAKRSELSSNQLNHVVTVIENWRQDEEGLQVHFIWFKQYFIQEFET